MEPSKSAGISVQTSNMVRHEEISQKVMAISPKIAIKSIPKDSTVYVSKPSCSKDNPQISITTGNILPSKQSTSSIISMSSSIEFNHSDTSSSVSVDSTHEVVKLWRLKRSHLGRKDKKRKDSGDKFNDGAMQKRLQAHKSAKYVKLLQEAVISKKIEKHGIVVSSPMVNVLTKIFDKSV